MAQAGGLGDVVTALGRAVLEEGHEVEIVMPKYDCIDYAQVKVRAGPPVCVRGGCGGCGGWGVGWGWCGAGVEGEEG